jgi:hypothetical protein
MPTLSFWKNVLKNFALDVGERKREEDAMKLLYTCMLTNDLNIEKSSLPSSWVRADG